MTNFELWKLELWKRNVLALAADHKRTCRSPDCEVSTYMLMQMAEAVGIVFTAEEKMLFM